MGKERKQTIVLLNKNELACLIGTYPQRLASLIAVSPPSTLKCGKQRNNQYRERREDEKCEMNLPTTTSSINTTNMYSKTLQKNN